MKKKVTLKADVEALAALTDIVTMSGSVIGLIFGKKKLKIVSAIVFMISIAAGAYLFMRHFGLLRLKRDKLSLDLDLDGDEEEDSDEDYSPEEENGKGGIEIDDSDEIQ